MQSFGLILDQRQGQTLLYCRSGKTARCHSRLVLTTKFRVRVSLIFYIQRLSRIWVLNLGISCKLHMPGIADIKRLWNYILSSVEVLKIQLIFTTQRFLYSPSLNANNAWWGHSTRDRKVVGSNPDKSNARWKLSYFLDASNGKWIRSEKKHYFLDVFAHSISNFICDLSFTLGIIARKVE